MYIYLLLFLFFCKPLHLQMPRTRGLKEDNMANQWTADEVMATFALAKSTHPRSYAIIRSRATALRGCAGAAQHIAHCAAKKIATWPIEQTVLAIVGEFAAFPYNNHATVDATLDDVDLSTVLRSRLADDVYWLSRVLGSLRIVIASRARGHCVFDKVPLLNTAGDIIAYSHQHADHGHCAAIRTEKRDSVDLCTTFTFEWQPPLTTQCKVLVMRSCLSHYYHLRRDRCVLPLVIDSAGTIALRVNNRVVRSGFGDDAALAPPFRYATNGRIVRSLSTRNASDMCSYAYLPSVSQILVRQLMANAYDYFNKFVGDERVKPEAREPFTYLAMSPAKPSFVEVYAKHVGLRGMERLVRMFEDLLSPWIHDVSPFVDGVQPLMAPNCVPWYGYERGTIAPKLQRLVEEYMQCEPAWRDWADGVSLRDVINTVVSWPIFDDLERVKKTLPHGEEVAAYMAAHVDPGHVPLYGHEDVFAAIGDTVYGTKVEFVGARVYARGTLLSGLYFKVFLNLCVFHDHMNPTNRKGNPKRRGQFLVWDVPLHFHDAIKCDGNNVPVFGDDGKVVVVRGSLSLYQDVQPSDFWAMPVEAVPDAMGPPLKAVPANFASQASAEKAADDMELLSAEELEEVLGSAFFGS